MDFLKTSWTQISEVFRSMTPGSRMITVLLLAAVVVSFGYLFTAGGGTGGESLMYGEPIPVASMPGMESAFQAAGLNDYTVRGNQIFVPTNQRGKYMAALTEAEALPPNFAALLDKEFSNLGTFATADERKQAIKSHKQKLLSWIINAMTNINKAMVLIDDKKLSAFSEPDQTAMVSLSTINGLSLTNKQVMSIRYLVSGAIAGLLPSEVTVVDQNGGAYPGIDDESGIGGGGGLDPILQRKAEYEANLQKKIYDVLSYVPNIKVSVTCEIDPEANKTEDNYELGPKPVSVITESNSSTETSETTKPGGEVGFSANAGVSASVASNTQSGTSSDSSTDNSTNVAIPNVTQTKTNYLGLIPKRAFVSIAIPDSYFVKQWEAMNPPAEGAAPTPPDPTMLTNLQNEAFEKIKAFLVGHLPEIANLTDPKSQVQLMAFSPPAPLAITEPSTSSDAMAWLTANWGTIGAFALVLISLMMVRSITKQPVMAASPETEEIEPIVEEAEANRLDEGAIQRLLDFGEVGPSLRDELAKLVDQDPDTAANILRNWIGVAD